MAKRIALYLRVSTDGQTTKNQRRELQQVAKARGWEVARVYDDDGVSGAKGREYRKADQGLYRYPRLGCAPKP